MPSGPSSGSSGSPDIYAAFLQAVGDPEAAKRQQDAASRLQASNWRRRSADEGRRGSRAAAAGFVPAVSRARTAEALSHDTGGPGRRVGASAGPLDDRFGTGEAATIAAASADEPGGHGGDVSDGSGYALPAGPAHIRTHAAPRECQTSSVRSAFQASKPPSPFARLDVQATLFSARTTATDPVSARTTATDPGPGPTTVGGWRPDMMPTRRSSPLRMGSGRAMSGGSCLEVVPEGDAVVTNPYSARSCE